MRSGQIQSKQRVTSRWRRVLWTDKLAECAAACCRHACGRNCLSQSLLELTAVGAVMALPGAMSEETVPSLTSNRLALTDSSPCDV